MVNYYRWLLLIPILILILGMGLLLSNEAIIKKAYATEESRSTIGTGANPDQLQPIPKRANTYPEDLRINRESAYPYFLLGAGLLVALLVLPKLTELSFSPTSGFTLKVLQEVKETLTEVKSTTQAVQAKARQSIRANAAAETLLAPTQPDLQTEINKLEESTTKLDTYARVLEKMLEKKQK